MPTEYDIELERIKRQQQIADAMTASGLEPIQVNRTAGPYVAPVHWAEVLGKWAQVYAGKRGADKASDKLLGVAREQEAARMARLQGYFNPPSASPAPAAPQPAQPQPQQPQEPQFEAQGMLANVLQDIGMRPNTAAPGVREKYTGPVDPLPGYLQTQRPSQPAAPAPAPAQGTNPFAGQMAQLQQRFQMAQQMAVDPDPQLAAIGAAEMKRVGELMQKYEEANIEQPWLRTVGDSLVDTSGGQAREAGYFGQQYGAPEQIQAGDGTVLVSQETKGRGAPVMQNAPIRSVGSVTNVNNIEETAFARRVGTANADYLGTNRESAATAWNQLGIADGLDANIKALETQGSTTGPLTNLRNFASSLALELNVPLDAKALERLVRSKALDAAGVAQLIDLFNQPGMSAYGLTAGETAELKRTFASGGQPIAVLKSISTRLRNRADGTLRTARQIYQEAQRDYRDVPRMYDPDLQRGRRETGTGRPGMSRDNPLPLP
jgi:hypothetical protein